MLAPGLYRVQGCRCMLLAGNSICCDGSTSGTRISEVEAHVKTIRDFVFVLRTISSIFVLEPRCQIESYVELHRGNHSTHHRSSPLPDIPGHFPQSSQKRTSPTTAKERHLKKRDPYCHRYLHYYHHRRRRSKYVLHRLVQACRYGLTGAGTCTPGGNCRVKNIYQAVTQAATTHKSAQTSKNGDLSLPHFSLRSVIFFDALPPGHPPRRLVSLRSFALRVRVRVMVSKPSFVRSFSARTSLSCRKAPIPLHR